MDISLPSTTPTFWQSIKVLPFFLRFLRSVDKWRFYLMFLDGFIRGALSWGLVVALNQLTQVVQRPVQIEALYLWTFITVIIIGILAFLHSLSLVIRDVFRHKVEVALHELNMTKVTHVNLATLEDPQFQALSHLYQQYRNLMMDLVMAFTGILYEGLEVIGLLIGLLVFPLPVLLIVIASLIIKFIIGSKVGVSSWTLMNIQSRGGLRALYYTSIFSRMNTAMEARLFGFAKTFSARWQEHINALLSERVKVTWYTGVALSVGDFVQLGALLLGCYLILNASNPALIVNILPFIVTYQRFQNVGSRFFGDSLWYLECTPILFIFKAFQSVPEETKVEEVDSTELLKPTITITFDNVWFRYPGSDIDVLQGVTFTFKEGEKLALVGSNGAGKSTLMKLLLGLYQPTHGKILINGISLNQIALSEWRNLLSVMFQHVSRYDDTIEEQVRYGQLDRDFNEQRFQEALKISGAGTFVDELNNGIATHVGKEFAMPEDQAIELSGGQSQMLAIARALYRQARFYIFDEPTSAVDAEKEEHFFAALPEATKTAGLLFISHRFSTLRRAERILVMETGKIIESGSHDQLLDRHGRYYELFSIQAKMYR